MWKYIYKHRKYPLVITVYAETDEAAQKELHRVIEDVRTTTIIGGSTIDLPTATEWNIHTKVTT
jgi:hypothetical protein